MSPPGPHSNDPVLKNKALGIRTPASAQGAVWAEVLMHYSDEVTVLGVVIHDLTVGADRLPARWGV